MKGEFLNTSSAPTSVGFGFRRRTIFSDDIATATDGDVRAGCGGDGLLVVAVDKFEERDGGERGRKRDGGIEEERDGGSFGILLSVNAH
ncbi:hypothetical protein TIFTF001_007287 [Ficus carica]|uniref:Uncharacterized protein n=1 Tax=Ficus carica TaxID=3494 RepID=A0AA87ZJ67_FICCA|nr:hypothetical protein TIFTF001_007287 [Ficus carica]